MLRLTGILSEYYNETDPKSRKHIYNSLEKESSECWFSELLPLIGSLYLLRYGKEKASARDVDFFLWYYVNLIQHYSASALFKKQYRRDALKIFADMGNETAKSFGEAGEDIIYLEYRNAARRYFNTCSASSYGRKAFGLIGASDEERSSRMREDAWKMSFGNAAKYGLELDTATFCRAIDDEYMSYTGSDVSLKQH